MGHRQPFMLLSSTNTLFLIILLLHTAVHADQSSSTSNLAKGTELTSEIEQLHLSLSRITSLLASSNIKEDTEIMSKTAKLVRRVRTLIHANESNSNNMVEVRKKQQQERNRLLRQKARRIRREEEAEEERRLRLGGIGNGEVEKIQEEEELMEMTWWTGDGHEMKGDSAVGGDSVERRLFDTTISFPECNGEFLERCLEILNDELIDISIEGAEYVIHEKRTQDQAGYNKVVIITDLSANYVSGRLHDGIVEYPWAFNEVQYDENGNALRDENDNLIGSPRMLGTNGDGKWNCHNQSPEQCCQMIKDGAPIMDTNGNYIQCIFVPFGGAGHAKRSDRVLVNLSGDGRVWESPFIA